MYLGHPSPIRVLGGPVQNFEVQFDALLDLRIVQVVRPVILTDLVSLTDRDFGGQSATNIIWDFWPGVLQLLDTRDMKNLRSLREKAAGDRRKGNTVLVTHDPAEKLFVKWYKKFAESEDGNQINYHVADSLEGARELIQRLVRD